MEVSVGSTLAVDIVDMRVLWYPLADGYVDMSVSIGFTLADGYC